MDDHVIGRPAKRVEDARFLTGRGRYISDVKLADVAEAVVVRSAHAAAILRSVDHAAAVTSPGVLGVFTASDIVGGLGTTTITFKRSRPDGTPMFWRPQPALARARVHYVGAMAAVMNAIMNALARLDVTKLDMPATPDRVWRAIREAQAKP